MPSGHDIHRLHEFLPHLAERQPGLLGMLPAQDRPAAGLPLVEWVWCLPQTRLMEICSAWVLESVRSLKDSSPLAAALVRGALLFAGEFDVSDAAAVSVGLAAPPGDPRRAEIRTALLKAARMGVLIHLPPTDRFCIPFPVRLSFEGIDYIDPSEASAIRSRMVHHFGSLAEEMSIQPELGTPRHWRFANMLTAYEFAADLAENSIGAEGFDWAHRGAEVQGMKEPIARPLIQFGRFLGKAMVQVQSGAGARLLGASAVAARDNADGDTEAETWGLLGQYHLRRKEFPDAIHAFRTAEGLRRGLGDDRSAVMSISAIGMAHRGMGNRELAVQEFLRACDAARLAELREEEIDTANCAAGLLILMGRTFEAARVARSVMSEDRPHGKSFPAASELLVYLGMALRREGHLDDARARLFEALELARGVLHRPAEARSSLEIGKVLHGQGEMEEAAKWFRRARSVFTELHDSSGVAECYLALFHALPAEEAVATGEELLQRALRSADARGDHDLLAVVWRERANLALRRNEPDAALTFLQHLAAALRMAGDASGLVSAHVGLAELYLEGNSPAAAMMEALRAQAIGRAYLRDEPATRIEAMIRDLLPKLGEGQFEFLTEQVTEELESGEVGPAR